MNAKLATGLKRGLLYGSTLVLVLLAARVIITQRTQPLELWHKYVPQELGIQQLDTADWNQYVQKEDDLFEDVRTHVSQQLEASAQTPGNRYFEGSPIYPGHFAHDWNHSYRLIPTGKPVGAVVLLHGLTDSPYSMRHIAQSYYEHGFVVVSLRLPGHGTVPAGLTSVEWEDWMAATRLAVREAQTHITAAMPLHIVGYSNGGALAMKYTLDAQESKSLRKPAHVVLVSPMIGVTRFARFAGLAGIPAVFPAFSSAAWLGIEPEFNPFKYNSFPVNGARQSYRLTAALQEQITRMARDNTLSNLPPVLTFQSVVDYTVSTSAIISALYNNLPANGSELVLFDVNRSIKFSPLLRTNADRALGRLLPTAPQHYRMTVIANASPGNTATVERSTDAGETHETQRALSLPYPVSVFSLSHVALPFPIDDPLYGMEPDPETEDEFGINLGTFTVRGERGALILNMDALSRITSNPFYPYMQKKIEANMNPRPVHVPAKARMLPAVLSTIEMTPDETLPGPDASP